MILKIIGIIILVILSIVLFLVLSLLFAPFVYRISAKKDENEEIWDSNAKISLSFMYILLNAKAEFRNGELYYAIRILGIDIFKILSLFDKVKKLFSKRSKKSGALKNKNEQVGDTTKSSADVSKEVLNKQESSKNTDSFDNVENNTEDIKEDIDITEKPKRKSIKDRISSVRKSFEKIKNTKDELGKKENKAAISFVLGLIKQALRSILPRKFKGKIVFGANGPDTTGKVLAVAAIFLPLYKDKLKIVPDFTKACFYGSIFAKGKIRLFTLLRIYIKLRRSSEYRQLLRLKNELSK